MNRRYRKTIIAGNWKMNMTASDTKKFADDIKAIMPRAKWCDVVVCVPFVNIPAALKAFKDLRISVGAQNMFYEKSGAYTGEVSADMLKDLGVKYVIIGHSERRQYFGETDFTVNKKVLAALEAGLHPIICVGESLEQRELGITMELIALQVKSALAGVPAEKLRKCVIAYEPIWAIGTGKTATAEQAAEVCTSIRTTVRHLYGGPHRPLHRHPVRRLHEARQRGGAAGPARYRRRPHRRRFPEACRLCGDHQRRQPGLSESTGGSAMNKAPTTLIIMDGFGLTGPGPGNAVSLAQTPQLDRLFAEYAHTTPVRQRPGRGSARRADGQQRGGPHQHRRRPGGVPGSAPHLPGHRRRQLL